MIGLFEIQAVRNEYPVAGCEFEVSLGPDDQPSASIDNVSLVVTLTGGCVSVRVPPGTEGRTLEVSAIQSDSIGEGKWIVRPKADHLQDVEIFATLTDDLRTPNYLNLQRFSRSRRWSYGDVENNGVYYHPNLTHYAHQVFEEFFYEHVGIHYVDLSRDNATSIQRRETKDILRMTFPVKWLYQYMTKPMEAGDEFNICLDTVDLTKRIIAVRAWILTPKDTVAAVVIWVRCAIQLPDRNIIHIPSWFPRLPRGNFP